eukprot:2146604-Alexandrium_andersonii.AAC.1
MENCRDNQELPIYRVHPEWYSGCAATSRGTIRDKPDHGTTKQAQTRSPAHLSRKQPEAISSTP